MPHRAKGLKWLKSRLGTWCDIRPTQPQQRDRPPAGSPSARPGPASEAPSHTTNSTCRRPVLVTVLGLSGRSLVEVLELVLRKADSTQTAPIFVTDSIDFSPFRQRRLRFEYLPDRDRQQRFAPALDWDLYLRRRYALLGDKWQAQSVISFGRPPPHGCVVDGRLAGRDREAAAPVGER